MAFAVSSELVLAEILRARLIAVLRFHGADECLAAADAAAAGGISVLEVTLTTPGASAIITALSRRDDLLIGVGSVRSAAELDAAAMAGARFVASPHIDPALVERARGLGLVTMPGALTPTEIHRAWRAGADLVKVFPMPRDGAAYLRSLLGPMPEVRLAPSGGVSPATVRTLLDAGASALNVGSWMTHDDGAAAPPEVVRARAAELVAAVRGVVV
ncbi:MAG TPA: 2-dehydro-3-deoxyphosphogluconate aldolase [Candidatus Kapabacteria bacterium]|nr:2-dehydro-3-deoxyphosphogluconate aldolase [Candidatus Kapabacteria bacterium]